MNKVSIVLFLTYLSNLGAMDWSNSFNRAEKEKRSSYNEQFKLSESSSELYTQVMCTPKKKEKRPNYKFKMLCKSFMYYQLITHQNLRSICEDELKSHFITLDLSARKISDLKNFLKQAIRAFQLSTGKKPKQKDLEDFSIHIIDLSNNNLSALPKRFTQLTQCIKWINLNNNQFKEVPQELELCKNLTFLDIGRNRQIKALPEWTDSVKVLSDIKTAKLNKNQDKKSGSFEKTWN